MRQATAALFRLGRIQARSYLSCSSPSSLSRIAGSQIILGSQRKDCLAFAGINPISRIGQVQSFQTGSFTSAAAAQVNSKDGTVGTSPEDPPSEDKSEPVSKPTSEKTDQTEQKPADKKTDSKAETQEQKLSKEVKKLEQLIREKDSLLEDKADLIKELKENILRSYADLENFRERATREAESTRKFSIQGFSKALLDVADNLERALTCVPEDFASKEPEEVKKLLKTIVEGVKMTEKQLSQVYKKFGVERFDPVNQTFDPNVHLAICEIADPSKTPGTVANVFKPGYMLHDRVLRPAEVSVVKEAEQAS